MLQTVRAILQRVLTKPVTWLANRFSSAPKQEAVFASLTELYQQLSSASKKNTADLSVIEATAQPIILLSDQHKGKRNGADDFASNESSYLAALAYYNSHEFTYINLGDCEELWENNIFSTLKHNKATFEAEKAFVKRAAFVKVYGNHDSFWRYDPLASQYLKQMYGQSIPVVGGTLLQFTNAANTPLHIMCTHGHQGDASSDGNWLSAAFVTYIWGPLQSFLRINTNTPAASKMLKSLHNSMMYQWSSRQPGLALITGHTHQPVFASLTHLERLLLQRQLAAANGDNETLRQLDKEIPKRRQEYDYVQLDFANLRPGYFNTGCCCFSDGNITGIEIHEGEIRLIKWEMQHQQAIRTVLEKMSLQELAQSLSANHQS
jgi:predicted phosphodiesterase